MIIDFLINIAGVVLAIFLFINTIIILLYIIVAILSGIIEFFSSIIESIKENREFKKKYK